jgi:hypothetical protein
MLALNGLGATGCDFAGYNFNTFVFNGYNDFAYPGGNVYNPIAAFGGNPANQANYLVDFSTSGSSINLTIRPDPSLPAWMVALPQTGFQRSEFTFEIKYNINALPGSPNIQTIVAGLNGVQYNTPGGGVTVGQATATFSKSEATFVAPNPQNSTTLTADKQSGNFSSPFAVLSPAPNVNVTDNLDIVIKNVSGGAPQSTTLSITSITNTFNPIPEPVTVGLIGAGLVGLGLLRRRMKA